MFYEKNKKKFQKRICLKMSSSGTIIFGYDNKNWIISIFPLLVAMDKAVWWKKVKKNFIKKSRINFIKINNFKFHLNNKFRNFMEKMQMELHKNIN